MHLDINDFFEPDIQALIAEKEDRDRFLLANAIPAQDNINTQAATLQSQMSEEELSLQDLKQLRTEEAPNGYDFCGEYGKKGREMLYGIWPAGTFRFIQPKDNIPKTKPSDVSIVMIRQQDMKHATITVWRGEGNEREKHDEHQVLLIN